MPKKICQAITITGWASFITWSLITIILIVFLGYNVIHPGPANEIENNLSGYTFISFCLLAIFLITTLINWLLTRKMNRIHTFVKPEE